jgi:hypothetical protein
MLIEPYYLIHIWCEVAPRAEIIDYSTEEIPFRYSLVNNVYDSIWDIVSLRCYVVSDHISVSIGVFHGRMQRGYRNIEGAWYKSAIAGVEVIRDNLVRLRQVHFSRDDVSHLDQILSV